MIQNGDSWSYSIPKDYEQNKKFKDTLANTQYGHNMNNSTSVHIDNLGSGPLTAAL